MTCKTDAAFDHGTMRAGFAWIFTVPTGFCFHQGSATEDSISSLLMAEAIALRHGVTTAVELGLQKLIFLSDNQTLIRAINNDTQVKEIFGIVKDIQRLSSDSVGFTFSHISRSSNVAADSLAKRSLSSLLY
ncbi:uncharacterized protein LOC130501344 [Raphanus sativus]|uniref:Uncharacterized protein LOC130501344 n=1 Tax=Raphanus sativus TaxID=3726 RepID=A0A9W3CL87_RAPSA|nr:uncharacterized protein LOC130501344 [Raphanus sativus]